jgi:phosphatidate cytidylyltransferase
MLKTRVITALVLVILLVPSIFLLPQPAWAILVAAVIGVAAWEWGVFLRWSENGRRWLGIGTALLCASVPLFDPAVLGGVGQFLPATGWVLAFYVVSAVFWCVLVPVWLRKQWTISGLSCLLVGAVVLLPTALALVQLRTLGPWALLGVFAVVWMADISAYFSGRAFGKRKMAPTISPGKTWAGAYGAFVGVVLYGIGVRFGVGLATPSLPLWIAALLFLTAISIIGDLFESLFKRKVGIKDSSNVLPGHGGLLDRIDSLTSTLPLVALLLALYPAL